MATPTFNDLVERIALKVQTGTLASNVGCSQLAALLNDQADPGRTLLTVGALIVALRTQLGQMGNMLTARNNLVAELQTRLRSRPA